MLQNLHVKNLALIDEVDIEFKNGLNILTGETGAGKSIIIGSINLALGARYNADILRQGAESGFVELSFFISNEAQIKKLNDLEVYLEEGMVVLSRKFMEGRSISRINGETVAVSHLKKVAEVLIDIYGQHEHQSLLYKKNHLLILDAYAKDKILTLKTEFKPAFELYKSWEKKLDEDKLGDEERRREAALIQFEVDEITEAQLTFGEDLVLEERYRKMLNAHKMSASIAETYNYTASNKEESATDLINHGIRALNECKGYGDKAEELLNQLVEVDELLTDFNRELADFQDALDFSEEEFHEVEQRLNVVNHLKSKYGNSMEQIQKYCEQKEQRLNELNHYENHLQMMMEEHHNAEEKVKRIGSELTEIRKKQAKSLEEKIKKSLLGLNFADVQFEIQVRPMEAYSLEGMDDVEFMVSLNPGEKLKSLSEVASGGELSRIMLAIKTTMASKEDTETLIFDEVDTGISGRTAQMVSEKISLLSCDHQVICITHLAQIASMADAHYLIEKGVYENKTRTDIVLLDEEESIKELARILGGAQITETVIENAKEMKKLAAKSKNGYN